jgi:MFS family permease
MLSRPALFEWLQTRGIGVPSLLRERNFALIWLIELVAISAGHISHLALPIIGTVVLHASPAQMGLLVALQALPFTLISLPAGVWVDRFSKKRLLIVCWVALILSIGMLPLAAWLKVLSLPLLYLAGFCVGAVMTLFGVAHQVLVTHVVGRERLVDAYRIISTTESIIRLAAPAAAGLLIQALGASWALTVEVIALCIVIAAFTRVHEPQSAQGGEAREAMWPQIREGLAYVWRDAGLRTMAATAALWQFMWHGYQALNVLFAARELGMNAGQIGLAHAFGGIGALIAGINIKRFNDRFGPPMVLALGLTLTGVSWAAFSVLPAAPGWNVLTMGLAILVFDLGAVCFFVNYISLRQILTPDALLGRVTATMRFAAVATAPFGAVAFGSIAEFIGLRWSFVLMGAGGVFVGWVLWRSKNVRHASQALA